MALSLSLFGDSIEWVLGRTLVARSLLSDLWVSEALSWGLMISNPLELLVTCELSLRPSENGFWVAK